MIAFSATLVRRTFTDGLAGVFDGAGRTETATYARLGTA
jgi:hypothetical protein